MLEKNTEEMPLDNTDFVAWRISQAKKKQQEKIVERGYNMRVRLRREIKD